MENLIELQKRIEGRAETKGFVFNQVAKTEDGFIYEREGKRPYYEVFRRKTEPVCIDFVNRVYSEDQRKEKYPNRNAFGTWAWTYPTKERALTKLKELEKQDEDI